MGCRIMVGTEQGTDREMAVLFDSVTGTAFGPTFGSVEEAEAYVKWLASVAIDPRQLSAGDHAIRHARFIECMKRVDHEVLRLAPKINRDDGETVVACFGPTVVHCEVLGGVATAQRIVRMTNLFTLDVDRSLGRMAGAFDLAETAIAKARSSHG